jgi:hypothetical protein
LPSPSEFDQIEALGTLKAFGFIKERIGGTSYDMHQLVYTAMQNWLKLKDEWRSWNQKSLRQISNIFPSPGYENRAIWMRYLPHAQYTMTSINMEPDRTEETKELLWILLYNLGLCYKLKGNYTKAYTMYLESLDLQETVLEKDHPYTLKCIVDFLALLSD